MNSKETNLLILQRFCKSKPNRRGCQIFSYPPVLNLFSFASCSLIFGTDGPKNSPSKNKRLWEGCPMPPIFLSSTSNYLRYAESDARNIGAKSQCVPFGTIMVTKLHTMHKNKVKRGSFFGVAKQLLSLRFCKATPDEREGVINEDIKKNKSFPSRGTAESKALISLDNRVGKPRTPPDKSDIDGWSRGVQTSQRLKKLPLEIKSFSKSKKLKVGDICVLKISALGPNGMGIDEYTYGCSIFVTKGITKRTTAINLGNIIKAKIVKINFKNATPEGVGQYAVAQIIGSDNNSLGEESSVAKTINTIVQPGQLLTVNIEKLVRGTKVLQVAKPKNKTFGGSLTATTLIESTSLTFVVPKELPESKGTNNLSIDPSFLPSGVRHLRSKSGIEKFQSSFIFTFGPRSSPEKVAKTFPRGHAFDSPNEVRKEGISQPPLFSCFVLAMHKDIVSPSGGNICKELPQKSSSREEQGKKLKKRTRSTSEPHPTHQLSFANGLIGGKGESGPKQLQDNRTNQDALSFRHSPRFSNTLGFPWKTYPSIPRAASALKKSKQTKLGRSWEEGKGPITKGLGIIDLKDGYKLIIPTAKISNNVAITVTRVKSKYAFAKIEKIHSPSDFDLLISSEAPSESSFFSGVPCEAEKKGHSQAAQLPRKKLKKKDEGRLSLNTVFSTDSVETKVQNLFQGSKYSLNLPKVGKYYGKYVIVKLEGSILFIKLLLDAKPGNKVRIKIIKVNKTFAIAKVISIYTHDSGGSYPFEDLRPGSDRPGAGALSRIDSGLPDPVQSSFATAESDRRTTIVAGPKDFPSPPYGPQLSIPDNMISNAKKDLLDGFVVSSELIGAPLRNTVGSLLFKKRLLIQNSIYQMVKNSMHLGEKAVKCNARMKNFLWKLPSCVAKKKMERSNFRVSTRNTFLGQSPPSPDYGEKDISKISGKVLRLSSTKAGTLENLIARQNRETLKNRQFASCLRKEARIKYKNQMAWEVSCATGTTKKEKLYGPRSTGGGKKEIPLIKKGRHIINLLKTRRCLNKALTQLSKYALKGKTFIFIGTKKPAAGLVARASLFSKTSFFVNTRWLGGMLTNWKTILKSISKIRPILKEKQKIVADILEKRQTIKQRLIKKALLLKKKSKLILNKGRILIDQFKNSSFGSVEDLPALNSGRFGVGMPSVPLLSTSETGPELLSNNKPVGSISPGAFAPGSYRAGSIEGRKKGLLVGVENGSFGTAKESRENIVLKTKKLASKKKQLIENCYSLLSKRQILITKRRELMYQSLILRDKGLQILSRYKSLLNQLTIYSKKIRELKYLLVLSSEIKNIKNRARQENKKILNISYNQVKELGVDNHKYNIIPNPPKDILNLILLTMIMTRNSSSLNQDPQKAAVDFPSFNLQNGAFSNLRVDEDVPNNLWAIEKYKTFKQVVILNSSDAMSKEEAQNERTRSGWSRPGVVALDRIDFSRSDPGLPHPDPIGTDLKTFPAMLPPLRSQESNVLIFSKLISKFSRFRPYLKILIKKYAQNITEIINSLSHCTKILMKIKTTFKKYVVLKNILIKELGFIKTKLTSERNIIRLVKAKVKHFVSQKRLIKFLPKLKYLATPLFTTKIMETVKILMKKIVDPKLKYPVDNIYDDKLSNNSKKVGAARRKKWQRLEKYFGGISNMTKMSKSQISKNVAIIIGQQEEMNAVYECQKLGIKMFNIVDTNCNPSFATHIIPANDDSKNSIKYILNKFLVRIRLSQKLLAKLKRKI